MPDTYILNNNNHLNILINKYKINNNLVFICKKYTKKRRLKNYK